MAGMSFEIKPMKRPQGLDPKKHPEPLVGVTVVVSGSPIRIFYVNPKKGMTSDVVMEIAQEFVNGILMGMSMVQPEVEQTEEDEATVRIRGYAPEYPSIKVEA